uniref:Neugrin n=1 Tax=Knipowitschia caucasica TaxID=637954 RepID=A0AAV2LYF0_KNICA
MFRPLQLLSSVLSSGCRTGALLSPSTVTLSRCRCASKAAQPWSRDMSTEDLDEEDQIQRVIDDQVKRHKSIKYHILRRKMRPLGPPERKLTWQAIDEIRYLKQEQPEEWTVARLAEGFSVSEDVILRILRSKFIPSSERKAKQDTQVVVKLKQQMLPPGAWVEQKKPKDKYSTESTAEDEEGDDEDEGWDGLVFTEGDIEELMSTVKSSPVLKEGNEFFDRNGNFLYKI